MFSNLHSRSTSWKQIAKGGYDFVCKALWKTDEIFDDIDDELSGETSYQNFIIDSIF